MYEIKNGKLFYHGHVINDVDLETIRIIGDCFFADKNGVYYSAKIPVESADPNSFQYLKDEYARDEKSIFSGSNKLDAIDPANFVCLGYNYAKDKNHIFYHKHILRDADAHSFRVIPHQDNYYGYACDHQHVYFNGEKLLDADPESFQIIEKEYAKDASHVYRMGRLIEGAIPADFVLIHSSTTHDGVYLGVLSLAHDQQSVFLNGDYLCKWADDFTWLGGHYYQVDKRIYCTGQSTPLENVDTTSFKVLALCWAKDDKKVYLENKTQQLDVNSFQILGDGYAKDDHQVFFLEEPIDVKDPASFELLGGGWANDKQQLYYESQILENSDPSEFRQLNEYYFVDAKQVYYFHKHYYVVDVMEGADPASFETLGGYYARDKNYVYFGMEALPGIDSESFEHIQYAFSQDKQFIYLGEDRLCERNESFRIIAPHKAIDNQYYYLGTEADERLSIDAASFVLIDEDYAKDSEQVFYGKYVIQGAEPKTFERVNQFYNRDQYSVFCQASKLDLHIQTLEFIDTCFARDKAKVYFLDHLIEGVDIESFEYVDQNFSRDRYHVYHRENIVEGADPESFEVVNYSEFVDKDFLYYFNHGEIQRKPRVKV